MFKKTLIAVAALAAFGSASAANVNLYGVIDQTLVYGHQTLEDANGKTNDSSFALESGYNSPSRFGLKGEEDLGNGLKVAFKLENGFGSDAGTLNQNGRLFGREASLTVSGDFGAVSFGRMGGVGSSCGTYDLVYGIADAFDGFDNDIGGLAISDRYDNMITYQTPKFAGVQATVQYSFKQDTTDDDLKTQREGSAYSNRYASAAVTGEFGNLNLVAAYEFQNYSSAINDDHDDGHTVYVGGNYNCGFATTFAMAQYFKGLKSAQLAWFDAVDRDDEETVVVDQYRDGIEGWGLHLGTNFPALGGDITLAAYYVDAKAEDSAEPKLDLNYTGIAARYTYNLSKRTAVYGGAGYGYTKYQDVAETDKEKLQQVYLGLVHTF